MDYLLQYFSTRDQRQQIDSEAGLLTRIFQRKYLDFLHWQNLNISAKEICYEIMDTYQEGDDKDLRMIKCRFIRIFNPEHKPAKFVLVFMLQISLTWINPN